MAHTDKQFAAGRKRAQAKASWSTPKTKKLPPMADFFKMNFRERVDVEKKARRKLPVLGDGSEGSQ